MRCLAATNRAQDGWIGLHDDRRVERNARGSRCRLPQRREGRPRGSHAGSSNERPRADARRSMTTPRSAPAHDDSGLLRSATMASPRARSSGTPRSRNPSDHHGGLKLPPFRRSASRSSSSRSRGGGHTRRARLVSSRGPRGQAGSVVLLHGGGIEGTDLEGILGVDEHALHGGEHGAGLGGGELARGRSGRRSSPGPGEAMLSSAPGACLPPRRIARGCGRPTPGSWPWPCACDGPRRPCPPRPRR